MGRPGVNGMTDQEGQLKQYFRNSNDDDDNDCDYDRYHDVNGDNDNHNSYKSKKETRVRRASPLALRAIPNCQMDGSVPEPPPSFPPSPPAPAPLPSSSRKASRLYILDCNNIKMDLREVGYDDRDWINLAQDRDQWGAYVRAAMNLQVPYKP
ncbi:hypothetical protein ANN_18347, partial [Periplaneta americana]